MKTLTREQVEQRKEKAVRFTRDVRNDSDRADEISQESVEDYAERKRIKIQNPGRMSYMAISKRELEERLNELEQENEALNDRLDEIVDLAAPEEEEEEEEEEPEPLPNRRQR